MCGEVGMRALAPKVVVEEKRQKLEERQSLRNIMENVKGALIRKKTVTNNIAQVNRLDYS